MLSISNTGDFLKVLKTLLEREAGERALVIYEGDDEPQDKVKPVIILPMPSIFETSWSDDGRHQDALEISVLVRVPKNISDSSVQCLNVAGFIRGLMTGQVYQDYIDVDSDHVDEPEDLSGFPLKWDTNDHGYEVSFNQNVRYGTVDIEPFKLVGIDLKEQDGEAVRIYECTS